MVNDCNEERKTLEEYTRTEAGQGYLGMLELQKIQSMRRSHQNQTEENNRVSNGASPVEETFI